MSRSRPTSRPVSRSNSISEAPINIPVDPRFNTAVRPAHGDREASFSERATHWLKKDGKDGHAHEHRHHHNDQDPKLFVSNLTIRPRTETCSLKLHFRVPVFHLLRPTAPKAMSDMFSSLLRCWPLSSLVSVCHCHFRYQRTLTRPNRFSPSDRAGTSPWHRLAVHCCRAIQGEPPVPFKPHANPRPRHSFRTCYTTRFT